MKVKEKGEREREFKKGRWGQEGEVGTWRGWGLPYKLL